MVTWQIPPSNDGDFRAIKSAVSLKPVVRNPRARYIAGFPRHQKRGLIEAPQFVSWAPLQDIFPRHQKRGLIEARNTAAGNGAWNAFPRHQKRGLIEAVPFSISKRLPENFRAIKSAVSLKLGECSR